MANLILPKNYRPLLSVRQIEAAIKDIKDFFERNLAQALNLQRVTAPLFVRSGTGVNDDLNGVERPVRFCVKDDGEAPVEIVQSLAKWKRMALARYGYAVGEGLYTDMNALRPDESLDNLHSIYVDQWDWEKIITPDERTRETLEAVVRAIYDVICRTEFHIASQHSSIRPVLPEKIHFVTSEDLYRQYPDLTPREREDQVCAEHKAVFIIGIGAELPDGRPHDGRAPDYDDWSTPRPDGGRGLNGDILLWNPVLGRAFEISSMGIRVDPPTLVEQLKIRGLEERARLPFHRMLLNGELPQTIGGGIGQSRLCMFFLRTAHVGEVSVGIWPESMERACSQANIALL
ncbi:MAG: aspartate--ammonia ligase [Thermoguttaceae bacterium]|jgi:aspartate--ammonia ligase|nr:aspartate--ammonia ligase [Thermoguttaceae bacterium]